MTYGVQRWIPEVANRTGRYMGMGRGNAAEGAIWVLDADAEAHEKEAVEAALNGDDFWPRRVMHAEKRGREQAIRDCIAALLSVSVRHWPYDETSDTYAECVTVDSAVDALHALLDHGTA